MSGASRSNAPDPKFLLDQLKMIDGVKFRSAAELPFDEYAKLCAELDETRSAVIAQVASLEIPAYPDPWSHEGLKNQIFEGKVEELRSTMPAVDTELLDELRAYAAALQQTEGDVDAAKQASFFNSRIWTDFGEPMSPAKSEAKSDADDFELADWAYFSALPLTASQAPGSEGGPKQTGAYEKILALLEEADDPAAPPVPPVGTKQTPATPVVSEPSNQPSAAASGWASWVQSMVNSGMISAESINASVPGLPPGVEPPTGSPPVESWTQWLDSSVKSKAAKPDDKKE